MSGRRVCCTVKAKVKAQLLEQFLILKVMKRDEERTAKLSVNLKATMPANYTGCGKAISLCQLVAVVELLPALFAANPSFRAVRDGAVHKWHEARQGLVLVDLGEQ